MTAREYIERCKELGVPVGPEVLHYKVKKPGPEEPTGYEARLAYFRNEGLKKRAKREHTTLPAHPSEPTGFVPLYRSTTMPQNGTLYSMGVEGRLSRLQRNLKDKSPEERTRAAAEAFSRADHTTPTIRRVGTCYYLYTEGKDAAGRFYLDRDEMRTIDQLVVPPLPIARKAAHTIPHDFFTQNVLRVPNSFPSDLPADPRDWHPHQRLFYKYAIETTKSYPPEERGLMVLSGIWSPDVVKTPGVVRHLKGKGYTDDQIHELYLERLREYMDNLEFLAALKEDKRRREDKDRKRGIRCVDETGRDIHGHTTAGTALKCRQGGAFYLIRDQDTYRSYRRRAKKAEASAEYGPIATANSDLGDDASLEDLVHCVDSVLTWRLPLAFAAQAVGAPYSLAKAREHRRRRVTALADDMGMSVERVRELPEEVKQAQRLYEAVKRLAAVSPSVRLVAARLLLVRAEEYRNDPTALFPMYPPPALMASWMLLAHYLLTANSVKLAGHVKVVKAVAAETDKPAGDVARVLVPKRPDMDHPKITPVRTSIPEPTHADDGRHMSDEKARKAASELQLPTGAPKLTTLQFLGAKPVSFEAKLPDGEMVTLHAARNVESVRYGTLAMQTLNVLEDRKSWPEKLKELNKKVAKSMTDAEVAMWLAKRALYSPPRERAALNARKILAEVLRRRDKKARERLVEEGYAFPADPPDDHDERVKTKSVPVALQLNADGTPLYALPEKLEAKAEGFVRVYPEAFARGIRPAILPPSSEACTQEHNNGVVWYSGPSLYAFGKNSGTWPAGKTGMARERQKFYQSVRSKNVSGDVADPTGEDALEDLGALTAELDTLEDERLAADAPEVEMETACSDNEVVESYDEAYDEGEEAPTGAELCRREWEEKIAPKLSEHELPAFLLAYFDGLSNGEIADRMGIAYDTARKLVLKARYKVEARTGRKLPNRNRGKGSAGDPGGAGAGSKAA
jgi:hypothetical protein